MLLDQNEFKKLEAFRKQLSPDDLPTQNAIRQLTQDPDIPGSKLFNLIKKMEAATDKALALTKVFRHQSTTLSSKPLEDITTELKLGYLSLEKRGDAPEEIAQLTNDVVVVFTQNFHIKPNDTEPSLYLGDFSLVRAGIPGIIALSQLPLPDKPHIHNLDQFLLEKMGDAAAFTLPEATLTGWINEYLDIPENETSLQPILGKIFEIELKRTPSKSTAELYTTLFMERFKLLDLDCSQDSSTQWHQEINNLYLSAAIVRHCRIEFRPIETPAFRTCKEWIKGGGTLKDMDIMRAPTEMEQSLLLHQIKGFLFLENPSFEPGTSLSEIKDYLIENALQFEGFFQHNKDGELLTAPANIFDPKLGWIPNPDAHVLDRSHPETSQKASPKISLDELARLLYAGYKGRLELNPSTKEVRWVFYPHDEKIRV